MPLDEDKYPGETDRRRFVKGVVGSAALASVGTGGAAAVTSATSVGGGGGGPTQYIAIENTDGPAPRGMPIIPVNVTSGGELEGVFPDTTTEEIGGEQVVVAEMDVGGVTYSSQWFQYCGVESYRGTQPDVDADNMLRAPSDPDYAWQEDQEAGNVLTIDMFDDYETWGNDIGRDGLGKPAEARWRSESEEAKTLPIQLIRSPEIPKMINGEQGFRDYSSLPEGVRDFLAEATDENVIAWLNKCTHFCCVPGYKTLTGSANFGGEDGVYCQCHQSVYDPFSPVLTQFIARPRPTEN